jgi:hypothetical protein
MLTKYISLPQTLLPYEFFNPFDAPCRLLLGRASSRCLRKDLAEGKAGIDAQR